ncbi:hypothetical protein CARUB_v10015396mg [Capsella rubella]|uniref:F-box domain-containing protein n=1 Tax=Capsella rubella TaxID=81985 RepID=R0I2K9_9BRAS|nr:hypothetical protein CARUB_v10015396mg [Capsella rubella]
MKNLPSELIEEILSWVPPKVLVRFRAVSKQWNALFEEKRFLNNHKMTFRFIIATIHKVYSVSIDPVIMVRELTLGTPGLESLELENLVDCNDLLLFGMMNGALIWNPWLGQSIWIEPSLKHSRMVFDGIVYHNKKYKMVAFSQNPNDFGIVYDISSDVWIDRPKSLADFVSLDTAVSLNGTLYWVSFKNETDPLCYQISKFDFSSRLFEYFCNLPCERKHIGDAFVLRVGSPQSNINYGNGDDVVWMNFMTFSSPNLPDLVETKYCSQPSYFIEDKRLVVCTYDKRGHTWIYILGENKLISKTRLILDNVVDTWHLHCTFFPSLVPVPAPGKREELAKLQS